MKILYRLPTFLFVLGVLISMGCSNAKLYKGEAGVGAAQINFCTTPPDAVSTKLKYIFVVDQSSYNQVNYILPNFPTDTPVVDGNGGTDPSGNIRYTPIINFLNAAQPSATTYYSTFFFNTNPIVPWKVFGGPMNEDNLLQSPWYLLGGAGDIQQTAASMSTQFTNILCPGGAPCPAAPQGDGGFADYTDTLGLVLNSIEQDLGYEASLVAGGGPLVTSSYVIFWISSAYPFFQNGPQPLSQIAQYEDDIKSTATSIMNLKSEPQFAQYIDSIIINTGFYTTNTSGSYSQQETYNVLQDMASIGQGSAVNFATNQVDFSKFIVPQADVPYTLKDIWIHDASAVWWNGQLMLDSDNDGIPDQVETQWGSNPNAYDSDQNGLGDGVEYFLFKSPCGSIPSGQLGSKGQSCTAAGAVTSFRGIPGCGAPGVYPNIYPDTDLDYLNDCEEGLIGTSRTDFDSNQDWVPDQLEWLYNIDFLYGTNSLNADPTNDGFSNYQKLKELFPINIPVTQLQGAQPLSYELTQTSSNNLQTCYNVDVSSIATMSTEDVIRVYIMESNQKIRHMRVLKNVTRISNGFVSINDGDFTP
jgi:hypothetical protein